MTHTDEQHRNRRLADNIAAGTAVPDLDEVMQTLRQMASAHLDVPGPRAAQLCDEIDRLSAEVDRLGAIERRAKAFVTINEPLTRRTATVILTGQDT